MAQSSPEDFPRALRRAFARRRRHLGTLWQRRMFALRRPETARAGRRRGRGVQPAYVEDLDLGSRAWKRGWPTVYAAGALVEHRHRATTSRYYAPEELDEILEVNYLRFLARAVSDGRLFRRLWQEFWTACGAQIAFFLLFGKKILAEKEEDKLKKCTQGENCFSKANIVAAAESPVQKRFAHRLVEWGKAADFR